MILSVLSFQNTQVKAIRDHLKPMFRQKKHLENRTSGSLDTVNCNLMPVIQLLLITIGHFENDL